MTFSKNSSNCYSDFHQYQQGTVTFDEVKGSIQLVQCDLLMILLSSSRNL